MADALLVEGRGRARSGNGGRAEAVARFGSGELSLADPMESPLLMGTGEVHSPGAYPRPGLAVKSQSDRRIR